MAWRQGGDVMTKVALLAAFLALSLSGRLKAQDAPDPKIEETRNKLRALDWQLGPRKITVGGNSTLSLPEGYVYLDEANTAKFEEINQNLSSGKEVMVAPKTLAWSAYLVFED